MSPAQPPRGAPGARVAVTNGQAVLIIIGVVISITIFTLPASIIELAGNDAYWSPLLATVPSLAALALVWWLGKRFDWAFPYQYAELILGRWLGGLISLLYVVFFVIVAGSVDQQMAIVTNTALMPQTPAAVIVALTMLPAAYVAYLGLEAIARLAQLLVPALILVVLSEAVALLPKLDFGYLLPILREGWRPALHGATLPAALRTEGAMVLAFILPHLTGRRRALQAGVFASCAVAFILAVNVVVIVCLFSPAEAARMGMPTLEATRQINLTRGLEHLETLLLVPWLMTLTVKVGLLIYLAATSLAHIFRLSDWHPLALPLASLIGIAGTLFYPSGTELAAASSNIRPAYALAMNLAIPALVAFAALALRRKGGGTGRGIQE